MTNTLYYNNAVLAETQYSAIAEEHNLSYDIVSEVVSQIERFGEPSYFNYTGPIRENIKAFADKISTTPKAAENIIPIKKNEDQDIVDRAAFGLMNAMTDQLGCGSFIITEEGVCTINPENPPQLITSYQVVSNVLKLRDLGDNIDDKSSWMLGSIVSELERYYGEEFEVGQVCNQETASYNTIWTATEVYKAFKDKRYSVSFTHHKEAYFAKIPPETKHLILSKSETYGLTSKHVRALASIAKLMEDDQVIRNIRSKDQAEDLIRVHKDNKVIYLVLENNEWTKINGTAAAIPTGRLVIDLKNLTVRKDNGEPVQIKKPSKKKS